MKIYLAGLYTSNFDIGGNLYRRLTPAERYHRDGVEYYLESYHYIHRQRYVDQIAKDQKKVFLDSGAFSAFTKGIEVNIQDYCDYIKKNTHIVDSIDGDTCASVLDGIGDPLKTWQNQMTMEAAGVRPLPCFHYGEDERYLEWYIERYQYITLGGMVPISTPQLEMWLDRIWDKYLTTSAGHPKLKVHGFGMTTDYLLERYPWYSVDSSSWVQIAANGNILMPGHGMVCTSLNSPALKQAGRHINNIPSIQREALIRMIEKSGFQLERLQTEYVSRWAFNCYAFKELNKKYQGEKMGYNRTYKSRQAVFF